MLHGEQVAAGRHARTARVDHLVGRTVAEEGAELLAQPVGRLEDAAVAEVLPVEAVERAGDVAGDRIDRLGLAAEALAAARVEDGAPRRPRRDAASVDARRERRPVGVGRLRLIGAGEGWSVRTPPARCQAEMPPSSTATLRWPSQRSIHHRRAAYTPPCPSRATTAVSGPMPSAATVRAKSARAGRGWRPLLPSSLRSGRDRDGDSAIPASATPGSASRRPRCRRDRSWCR